MKFRIVQASDGRDVLDKLGIKVVPDDGWHDNAGEIEITTLEQLVEIAKMVPEGIVVHERGFKGRELNITIYDDYVE